MHHAFPRECPYPRAAGVTNPQPEEWMAHAGQESFATQEEMRRYADVAKPKKVSEEVLELHDIHWTTEEELLVPFSARAPFTAKTEAGSRSVLWFVFSVVMLSAALVSVASRAAAPVKIAKAALESLRHPDEIAKIKAETSWSEPVRDASVMRLRSRGASYLPA